VPLRSHDQHVVPDGGGRSGTLSTLPVSEQAFDYELVRTRSSKSGRRRTSVSIEWTLACRR